MNDIYPKKVIVEDEEGLSCSVIEISNKQEENMLKKLDSFISVYPYTPEIVKKCYECFMKEIN